MKQITEDFVSFEAAKLLKEKGFDNEEVSENGGFYCDYKCDGTDIGIVYESEMLNKDLARNEYLRPTHQMALKWLREVHLIDIEVRTHYLNYLKPNDTRYYSGKILKGSDDIIYTIYSKDTYEEVVEALLLYVLKNLI